MPQTAIPAIQITARIGSTGMVSAVFGDTEPAGFSTRTTIGERLVNEAVIFPVARSTLEGLIVSHAVPFQCLIITTS